MHETDVHKLAEQIANLIALPRADDSVLQASIERIEQRLTTLEAASISNPRSEISNLRASHPSVDKFNIAEAIVDGLFARQAKEKACTFEPSKPCDHCSMCNSRGF